MDSLKQLGEICKQHYEKLILIVALVVLGVAVCWLYMENEREKEKIKEFFTEAQRKSAKMVPPADLTNYYAAVAKLQNPPPLELTLPHYLFNPVKWKQTQGGLIKEVKGTESGIDLLEVVSITPLNFTIAFERKAGPGFWINVTNEVIVSAGRRIAQFATLNSTNTKVFILREVQPPPPEDPAQDAEWLKQAQLVLELKETGERITISKEKPFVRADAYQTDLRYGPDNRMFSKQRVGAQLTFGGESYKIVGINQNEVELMASNDKKYTKRYSPGAPAASAAASPATGNGAR
jgi:hypothetical protein